MTPQERFTALGPLILTVVSQITEDILLLPTLTPADTSALAAIFAPLLILEQLFPRTRVTEFMFSWGKYKLVPSLLEGDIPGITALWRSGRLSQTGWGADDVIEIVERRFGRMAEGIVREIRRQQYTSY